MAPWSFTVGDRMMEPDIGVTLEVHIDLFPPEQGGLAVPIKSGYRPLCIVPTPDGRDVVIGLCELELAEQLAPGASGDGRLAFSSGVSDDVKRFLSVGASFSLAEGGRSIGRAEVRDVK
jgi:hypothetical protein